MEFGSGADELMEEGDFDLIVPLRTEFVFRKQLANTPLLNAAGELAANIEALQRGSKTLDDGAAEKNEDIRFD